MRNRRCLRDKVVVPSGFLPAGRQRASFRPPLPQTLFGAFVSATIPPKLPNVLLPWFFLHIYIQIDCGVRSWIMWLLEPFPSQSSPGMELEDFSLFYSGVVRTAEDISPPLFFLFWIDDDKGTCRAKKKSGKITLDSSNHGRLFVVGCFLFPPPDNQVKRGGAEWRHSFFTGCAAAVYKQRTYKSSLLESLPKFSCNSL